MQMIICGVSLAAANNGCAMAHGEEAAESEMK